MYHGGNMSKVAEMSEKDVLDVAAGGVRTR